VRGGRGSCVTSFSDYDNDGWTDLWVGVCNDVDDLPTPFYLYRNNHDGTFTDVADKAGLNVDPGYWMAITFGDIDNDGDLDMFSTNFGPVTPQGPPEPHVLFRNNGDGTYSHVPDDKLWLNTFAFGATFGDWDNDGWQDLYVVGDQALAGFIGPGAGTPGYLYFNDGKGELKDTGAPPGVDLSNKFTSGVAKADFNGDGFLDVAVAASAYQAQDPNTGQVVLSDEGAPVLLTNRGNENHWVTVRLTGTESNRMAIGAKLELDTAGGLHQTLETYAGYAFLSGESPWPTFGMGRATKGALKVTWPNGRKEWFAVSSDRVIDLTEGTGSATAIKP
jgi:enediyne biosynthesis protein E4